MSDPASIISDEEITRVHGHANFGSMTPREVVNDGVRKYAIGYSGGHTQLCILLEHGLITNPKPGSYRANLTQKGKRYARAVSEERSDLLPAAEKRADTAEAEVKRLREALAWYADPDRYRPHPHGIAFDRRDISYVAVATLAASTEGR